MAFEQILASVNRLCELEEARRESLQEEFEDCETGGSYAFERTRAVISQERKALSELKDLLGVERDQIDQLAEDTAHLSVAQAVCHREASIEKLTAHNQALRTFHDSLSTALDIVETNLNLVESGRVDEVSEDPEPHVESSRTALVTHNEAIEGLRDNLTILNAFLV